MRADSALKRAKTIARKLALFSVRGRPDNRGDLIEAFRQVLRLLGLDVPPVEPIDPGDGSIVTRFGIPPTDLSGAIKRYWPASEWVSAAEVSYKESAGWRKESWNDTTIRYGPCGTPYIMPDGRRAVTEKSGGYWQINTCVHPLTKAECFDPDISTRYAVSLWEQAGRKYTPWWYTAGELGLER